MKFYHKLTREPDLLRSGNALLLNTKCEQHEINLLIDGRDPEVTLWLLNEGIDRNEKYILEEINK